MVILKYLKGACNPTGRNGHTLVSEGKGINWFCALLIYQLVCPFRFIDFASGREGREERGVEGKEGEWREGEWREGGSGGKGGVEGRGVDEEGKGGGEI